MTDITQTFDPPLPSDNAATFNSKAFGVVAGLNAWSAQANAQAAEVNAAAAAADTSKQAAASSANTALSHANTALTHANTANSALEAAVQASGAVRWVSGTTYAQDKVVISPIDLLSYRRKTAGAGTTDPSLDEANYTRLGTGRLPRIVRTGNVTLGLGDLGDWIDITSGTFTQTFAAAATLGSGWWCYLSNSGTGDITLDPSGAETIDSLASYVMYPGEVRLVQCDGAALRTVVLNSFYRVFTASGNFIRPPGYTVFEGLLWGGGGSGGCGNYAGGGGGGACHPFSMASAAVSGTVPVTIASGGAGVTGVFVVGNAGGTSSFMTVSAYGGGGGGASDASNVAGGGGGGVLGAGGVGSGASSSGGAPAIAPGGTGTYSNPGFGGAHGSSGGVSNRAECSSVYGGGAGGTGRPIAGLTGGASIYGGGGGRSGSTLTATGGPSAHGGSGGMTAGAVGNAPAGGGAGNVASTTSGAGARGELRIWGVI